MIKRTFDKLKRYRAAFYLRMSDKKNQNARSPEQQKNTIYETMTRNKCPWNVVKSYRDDGIKGRLFRRRPGLQALLRDIKAGLIQIDLIVVDTWERFGRADEYEQIRRELMVNHGVMIVTADTDFADPTGIIGKAVGMIENIRATEENRVKAHNVIRGKKDAIRQNRWPGGPRPFGYQLEPHVDRSGPKPRMYSVPVVDPEEAPVMGRIFALAANTGWRGNRLARALNADETIPDKFKPFNGSTIDYWLGNSMYIGTYVWGEHCCDIVNDARVMEPNPNPDEILRQEGFCEPIVDPAIFNVVKATIDARAAALAAKRAAEAEAQPGKLIEPIAGGISVKYEFSGICRCGECGASMVARPSGRKSKGGMIYSYYCCPRYLAGACGNKHHVRIEDLRPAVFSRLRAKLFPLTDEVARVPDWFPGLVEQVESVLDRRKATQPDRLAAVRRHVEELDGQMTGWLASISNLKLSESTRQDILNQYEQAKQAKLVLEQEMARDAALDEHLDKVLDPSLVLKRLQRLETVMASANITLVNVELARHIGRIDCYPDGRVIMRGTYLGVLEGTQSLLGGVTVAAPVQQVTSSRFAAVVPRRLTQRKVFEADATGKVSTGANEVGIDPTRFEGLAPQFVWDEEIGLPERLSWAETHAMAVWEFDQQHPDLLRDKLCEHFGKSRPTILKSLRIATERLKRDGGEPPAAMPA